VLDEPTSGVDPLARAALWETVREQAGRGVGVLVTTHYLQEAEQCDRLLLMAGGRVVAEGTVADVIGDAHCVAVHTDSWADAFAALDAAGQPVTLAGRSVRVADADPAVVSTLLRDAGVVAEVAVVRATLEERMTVLTRAAGH
jgi:ABC-type multidrug transport system ATPase subunit